MENEGEEIMNIEGNDGDINESINISSIMIKDEDIPAVILEDCGNEGTVEIVYILRF